MSLRSINFQLILNLYKFKKSLSNFLFASNTSKAQKALESSWFVIYVNLINVSLSSLKSEEVIAGKVSFSFKKWKHSNFRINRTSSYLPATEDFLNPTEKVFSHVKYWLENFFNLRSLYSLSYHGMGRAFDELI